MEHRWGERLSVDIAVRVAIRPFAVRTGRITNLSLSGACIALPFHVRPLARVHVALANRFNHATPVISAYVCRKVKDGIGVEWCEFAPQAVLELLRSAKGRRLDPHRGDALPPAPAEGERTLAIALQRR